MAKAKKKDLKELCNGLQKAMLTSLTVDREFITHFVSKGDASEYRWIEFLRTYLPDRYKVDKAMVIDSEGEISEQIDVVIYDGLYTPFIFKQDNHLYIPAESVYAVFEVKQEINKRNVIYAAKKVASVRKLKRTSASMVASGEKKGPRPLTKIVGGILATKNSISIDALEDHLRGLTELENGLGTLDLGCCGDKGSFYVEYIETEPDVKDECKYIKDLYKNREVKEIKFSEEEVSLFTFFFQLVNYMKSIGTVPAIDVNAYLAAIGEKIDENI